jgi:hypothetical protein
MFGVFRHERDGLADEDTRRRMRLIVPHIRRAALIGKVSTPVPPRLAIGPG